MNVGVVAALFGGKNRWEYVMLQEVEDAEHLVSELVRLL